MKQYNDDCFVISLSEQLQYGIHPFFYLFFYFLNCIE